ncbi:MAG: hypothetical protein H7Y17_08325, partial [Chlorobia bacterium]|nr:hypothetical protein [Fimbriimonadaceae bacterium]
LDEEKAADEKLTTISTDEVLPSALNSEAEEDDSEDNDAATTKSRGGSMPQAKSSPQASGRKKASNR